MGENGLYLGIETSELARLSSNKSEQCAKKLSTLGLHRPCNQMFKSIWIKICLSQIGH